MGQNALIVRFHSLGGGTAYTVLEVAERLRKDKGVIDEIPGAYKDINVAMEHQHDLTEIVHTLKQVVCVKG